MKKPNGSEKEKMLISPEEIREKALKKYSRFLQSYITGEQFFPLEINFRKIKSGESLKNFKNISLSLEKLKSESKSETIPSYSIEYNEIKNRYIGKQLFPVRIFFNTADDYLNFTFKKSEFDIFIQNCRLILDAFPELKDWILCNTDRVCLTSVSWTDILKVLAYFRINPRPFLYIRELPVEVDTKFIENNKVLFRQLLDIIIPDYINPEETVFEKRFNLKENEPLLRIKILDKAIAGNFFSGISDMSITISDFNKLNLPLQKIIILENKTSFSNIFNFLSLPDMTETAAIFGKGFSAGIMKDALWMKSIRIYYWGDIDFHGFMILSMLRSGLPQIESIMMDITTFKLFENFAVNDPNMKKAFLPNLNDKEQKLFNILQNTNSKNRLEQERIPHSYAVKIIKKVMI